MAVIDFQAVLDYNSKSAEVSNLLGLFKYSFVPTSTPSSRKPSTPIDTRNNHPSQMRSFIKVALFFAVNGLAIKYPYDGAHYGNWPGENGVSCYAHYAFPASELDKLIAATEPVNQDAYPDVEYLSPWGFVHPSYGNEAINARIKFVFRQFGDIEGETTLDALEIIADLGAGTEDCTW